MINRSTKIISSFVNQATHELIGYKLTYKDRNTNFTKDIHNLDQGTLYNPLVRIDQVGRKRTDEVIKSRLKKLDTPVMVWNSININGYRFDS